MRAANQKAHRDKQHTAHNDKDADAIYTGADEVHNLPKIFHGCLYCRKARWFSMLYLRILAECRGGSASPKTMATRSPRAQISGGTAASTCQRVEDNAFHLRAIIPQERRRRPRDVRCD